METADPHGRNAKTRPAVIVSRTEEIQADGMIACVAVTTTIPDKPTEGCIPLPFNPGGKSRTGLKKRSAAVCTWLFQVTEAEIMKFIGITPPNELQKILAYLEQHSPDQHENRE